MSLNRELRPRLCSSPTGHSSSLFRAILPRATLLAPTSMSPAVPMKASHSRLNATGTKPLLTKLSALFPSARFPKLLSFCSHRSQTTWSMMQQGHHWRWRYSPSQLLKNHSRWVLFYLFFVFLGGAVMTTFTSFIGAFDFFLFQVSEPELTDIIECRWDRFPNAEGLSVVDPPGPSTCCRARSRWTLRRCGPGISRIQSVITVSTLRDAYIFFKSSHSRFKNFLADGCALLVFFFFLLTLGCGPSATARDDRRWSLDLWIHTSNHMCTWSANMHFILLASLVNLWILSVFYLAYRQWNPNLAVSSLTVSWFVFEFTWLPKSLVLQDNFSFSGLTRPLAVFTASQCTTSNLCCCFPIFRHDGNCVKTRSSLRRGSIGHTVTLSTLCRAGTNLIGTS